MKRNLLLIGLIFSLSMNLAVVFTVGYSWWRRKEAQSQQRPFLPKDFSERLTARELEEVRNLRQLSLARADELKEILRQRRDLLIEELSEPHPDREKIDEILRDIGRLQLELEKEVIGNLLRISGLLPPKQRERVLNMMRERLREGGKWRVPGRSAMPQRPKGR